MYGGSSDAAAVARLLVSGVVAFALAEMVLAASSPVALLHPYAAGLGYLVGGACLLLASVVALVRRRARARAALVAIALWMLPLLAAAGPAEAARRLFPGVPLSAEPFAMVALFVLFCLGAFLAHAAREGPLQGVVLGFLAPALLGAFVLACVTARDVLGSREWRNRRIALRVERVEWRDGALGVAAVLDLTRGDPADLAKITDPSATYFFSRAYYVDTRRGLLEWSGAPGRYQPWTPGTYPVRLTFPDVGTGPERDGGTSEVRFWLNTPSEVGGMESIWETRFAIAPPSRPGTRARPPA
jgi:hypothetical protein